MRRIRLQFGLRHALLLTLLVAVVAGFCAHVQEIDRDKCRRVDAFNLALDQQRYEDAGKIARDAAAIYPSEKAMTFMVQKWQVADALMHGIEPPGGFVCVLKDEPQHSILSAESEQAWKTLSARQKHAP